MRIASKILPRAGYCSVWLIVLLLIAPAASPDLGIVHAQNDSTRPSQEKPPQDQDQLETFKVTVNVVNILFNVKDKHGALVPDLKRNDFELFEEGQPQTVKYFTAENNLPLTLGMLIDTSGSEQRMLPMEKDVAADFLREVIREKDLAFVINFDVNVELVQDFTSSSRDLRKALDQLRINTGGGSTGVPGMGGGPIPNSHPRGTALYDAVYLAGEEKLAPEVGRKAMIILTDGVDEGSKLKLREAIEAAQKADAICYVLLIFDRGFQPPGDREMRQLTEETGGRMIDVGNQQNKLKEAFDQIANELRSQYSIGYNPTNAKRDGTFRKIEIRTKAGKVQARKGYYAPTK